MNTSSLQAHRAKALPGAATGLRVPGMFALLSLESRARADGIESARARFYSATTTPHDRLARLGAVHDYPGLVSL